MADKRIIDRIRRMELYFDTVSYTLKNYPDMLKKDRYISKMLTALTDYYENGQWLKDYEADERGELSEDLKRGVLSEDGLHDLLSQIDEK